MMLTVGSQRSYSDVCQLRGGEIERAGNKIKIIHLDEPSGRLSCDAGCTLEDVNKVIIPRGWFFPVVPGTQYATIGGCIANDVHGKNHESEGSFGHHVLSLDLLRSDASLTRLTHGKMFTATVGGLGLTGSITRAEIQLKRQSRVFKPWYFPLDYIPWYWPAYKRLGLVQYHCVVPQYAVQSIFKHMRRHPKPLLTVQKTFGDMPSVGMLSFCRPGISISMDFINHGKSTAQMFAMLDNIVGCSGGAIYPAKTNMSRKMFRASFPRWQLFSRYVDPNYSSDFWERVK